MIKGFKHNSARGSWYFFTGSDFGARCGRIRMSLVARFKRGEHLF